jgi:hypothetical protein
MPKVTKNEIAAALLPPSNDNFSSSRGPRGRGDREDEIAALRSQ